MNRIKRIFRDMKYRRKLTVLLILTSLLPMVLLALYNHMRIENLTRKNEMESMEFLLEQTRVSIDTQILTFSNLMNYLTYSPDLEEIIEEDTLDNYSAYEQYTRDVDPLLSVPKSYHDAISEIRLFARSVRVAHEYTLLPLSDIEKEWWYDEISEDSKIQWLVNREENEIVGIRRIYHGQELRAVLCVTLDLNKLLMPFENIITEDDYGMIADQNGKILYLKKWDKIPGQTADADASSAEEHVDVLEQDAESVISSLERSCIFVQGNSQENTWVYYLFKPQSIVSDAVRKLTIEELPFILLCLILIFSLGMIFSGFITRPIEQLTANMAEVNAGSREVTVNSESNDEVGQLVRMFRLMMDEINRLIHEQYENRIAMKEFELKALQAQINPHFLYNSLSVINWMAIRSKQKEISKMTIALSTFYRTALSRGEDMVTVETCIKNIEAYMEIQQVMHDHDFQVLWNIDEDIKKEKIPKLLLQPVVENAIEHGLAEKEDGQKILKISMLDKGNEFLLTVEDNGCGMKQEDADKLVSYHAVGYGLKNVNDRILLLYGKEYALKIFSEEKKGTRVEMRFPKGVRINEQVQ